MHRRNNPAAMESNRKYGDPNDPERPTPPKPTLRRVLALAKEDSKTLGLGLFFLTLSSLCNLALPKVAGDVVDVVSKGKAATEEELREVCIALVVIAIFGGICSGCRAFIFTVCGERLAARLRKRLYTSIISQETGFFDTNRTGELINRISADTQVAIDETVILLHLPLGLVGASIVMERERHQNDSLVNG